MDDPAAGSNSDGVWIGERSKGKAQAMRPLYTPAEQKGNPLGAVAAFPPGDHLTFPVAVNQDVGLCPA